MSFRQSSTILHLGLGSFHRAHQAVYLQHLLDKGKPTGLLPLEIFDPA